AAGRRGRERVPGPGVRHVPSRRRQRPGPVARRPVRQVRDAHLGRDHRRRRRLRPRVDHQPAGEARRRLPARHADVPGLAVRRGRHAAHRVRQIAQGGRWIMSEPEGRRNYLDVEYGVRSWLLTVDHKRIALLYLVSITIMFVLGGLFAVGIRLELLTPAGDFVPAHAYHKLFTMHGVIMVFFFLIPAIPAVLGNFLIPLMIGARDLAFPRLNLLSWYLYIAGAAFGVYAMVRGGVDTGWTFYVPYSTLYSNTNVVATGVASFIIGFSSLLTRVNFIVTIHKMRAPGLTWFRLPLFVWAHYATSIIMVLGTPVIAVTLLTVIVERTFHLGLFDPALGGD